MRADKKRTGWLAMAVAAMLVASCANAATNARISDPSKLDRQYMAQQRDLLQDIAMTDLGRRFRGDTDSDLQILQLMLDRGLVKPDQTRELQAMGVVMGDLLAADLDMHWVIYEDHRGRSRALRYKETGEYLFPITMISRRRAAGNLTPVREIYQKAYDIIAPLRPPLPFQ